MADETETESRLLDALPVHEPRREAPNTVERGQRIALGVSLIRQGDSCREASRQTGIDDVVLWRRAKRTETITEDDPDAVRRIHPKASVLTEQSLERMSRDLDLAEPKLLAGWLTAAAKVAGVIGSHDPLASAGSALDSMLDALQGGDTLTLAAKLERSTDKQR